MGSNTGSKIALSAAAAAMVGGGAAGLASPIIWMLVKHGHAGLPVSALFSGIMSPLIILVGGMIGFAHTPLVLLTGAPLWLAGRRWPLLGHWITWVLAAAIVAPLFALRRSLFGHEIIGHDQITWLILFVLGGLVAMIVFRGLLLVFLNPPPAA